MTAKLLSGAVSSTLTALSQQRHQQNRLVLIACSGLQARSYAGAQQPRPRNPNVVASPVSSHEYNVRNALEIITGKATGDEVNPPRSTLPPPLNLPTRGSEPVYQYWFRIGRAYAGFYKDGIKAVWFNYQAASKLRQRITQEQGAKNVTDAVGRGLLTRSEFQLLARNTHDIGKLPLFGLLAFIVGEWLPLVVPFIPSAVPGTSRIPSQVRDLRRKAEERRRESFRLGITEPEPAQSTGSEEVDGVKVEWPMAFDAGYRSKILAGWQANQLLHVSTVLGLHSRLWDRVQLAPPAMLLRRSIDRRLRQVSQDDYLLIRGGGAGRLLTEELEAACEERGLDIVGRADEQLRKNLTWWLKRQQDDSGGGRALQTMLFRRLAIRDWVKLNVSANAQSQE